MFDIGVGELGLIALVGLLVLGPERLPRVARTTGALVRKARASWQSVRADIERELAAEDLRRSIEQAAAAADPMPDVRRAVDATTAPFAPPTGPLAPPTAPLAPPAATPAPSADAGDAGKPDHGH